MREHVMAFPACRFLTSARMISSRWSHPSVSFPTVPTISGVPSVTSSTVFRFFTSSRDNGWEIIRVTAIMRRGTRESVQNSSLHAYARLQHVHVSRQHIRYDPPLWRISHVSNTWYSWIIKRPGKIRVANNKCILMKKNFSAKNKNDFYLFNCINWYFSIVCTIL